MLGEEKQKRPPWPGDRHRAEIDIGGYL